MLLRLIGAPLKSLHIDMKDSNLISGSDVKGILQACPELRFFYLRRARIGSLDVFEDAYSRDACRISTLSLWNVEVSNDSLTSFAAILADSNHPMTEKLRQFCYIWDDIGCHGDQHRPNTRGIQAFRSMLARNKRLDFFELGMGEGLYRKYAKSFEVFDNTKSDGATTGLPWKCKAAFLSCVHIVEAGPSTREKKRRRVYTVLGPARFTLDQQSVIMILDFARSMSVRVVQITKILSDKKVKRVVM